MAIVNFVGAQEMLDARERRAMRQEEMKALGTDSIISFTLNIAGQIKQNEKIKKCFYIGVKQIKNQLKKRSLFAICDGCCYARLKPVLKRE